MLKKLYIIAGIVAAYFVAQVCSFILAATLVNVVYGGKSPEYVGWLYTPVNIPNVLFYIIFALFIILLFWIAGKSNS